MKPDKIGYYYIDNVYPLSFKEYSIVLQKELILSVYIDDNNELELEVNGMRLKDKEKIEMQSKEYEKYF